MKKKILALALVVAMLAVAVVSGTLAYFTDIENQLENVFTFGNVDIKLIESQFTINEENDADTIRNDAPGFQANFTEVYANNLVPTDYVAKNPYIDNVGSADAYVWFMVTVHQDVADIITVDWNDEYYTVQELGPFWDSVNEEYYTAYRVYNKTALAAGEICEEPAFFGFEVNSGVTNQDVAAIDFESQINVQGYAIQADGFTDFIEAFTAYQANGAGSYGQTGIQ